MKKQSKEKECCGDCCWFYAEQTDGDGICAEMKDIPWPDNVSCGDGCKISVGGCDNPAYISRERMRHYIAVLLQANRYRRDHNVPAIYRMPDPTELGKAIDFACKYMKVFSRL